MGREVARTGVGTGSRIDRRCKKGLLPFSRRDARKGRLWSSWVTAAAKGLPSRHPGKITDVNFRPGTKIYPGHVTKHEHRDFAVGKDKRWTRVQVWFRMGTDFPDRKLAATWTGLRKQV